MTVTAPQDTEVEVRSDPVVVHDDVMVIPDPEPSEGPAPVRGRSTAPQLTDADVYRALMFGLTVGTAVMSAIVFIVCVAAGTSASEAAQIAPWPGLVAGMFFGTGAYAARLLHRLEKH